MEELFEDSKIALDPHDLSVQGLARAFDPLMEKLARFQVQIALAESEPATWKQLFLLLLKLWEQGHLRKGAWKGKNYGGNPEAVREQIQKELQSIPAARTKEEMSFHVPTPVVPQVKPTGSGNLVQPLKDNNKRLSLMIGSSNHASSKEHGCGNANQRNQFHKSTNTIWMQLPKKMQKKCELYIKHSNVGGGTRRKVEGKGTTVCRQGVGLLV